MPDIFNTMSGGVRGIPQFSGQFAAPAIPTFTPGGGGAGFDYGTLSKIFGGALTAGGGLAALGYGGSRTNFDPTLTEESARRLIAQRGKGAYSTLGRMGSQARQRAASGFAGRGLGSSGAAIGDIADIDIQLAERYGEIEADMAAQLAELLQYIDQRDLQLATQQAAEGREVFGTLGDLALTIGPLLL